MEQNQEMYYKNVEQIQEVYVEENQVDMSNKMRFPVQLAKKGREKNTFCSVREEG